MIPANPTIDASLSHRSLRAIHFMVLLSIFGLLSGCAGWMRPPEHDPQALQWVTHWTGRNTEIENFKGLLQVQILAHGQTINGRAAVAGAVPDRLRLEFLSFIGQPLFSVAADGRTITLIDLREGKISRLEQTQKALERIVGMPISVRTLLEVLLGRPPVQEYIAAVRPAESETQCAVELKGRWHETVADILSDGCEHPDVLNVYDREGQWEYTVQWLKWQSIQGYSLPQRVMITSAEGARINFTIDRFWPDTPLPSSTFILEPPGN